MSKTQSSDGGGLWKNNHPKHEGNIGGKYGRLSRYSFLTVDPNTGKTVRRFHQEAFSNKLRNTGLTGNR